jgi:hypothetical protein
VFGTASLPLPAHGLSLLAGVLLFLLVELEKQVRLRWLGRRKGRLRV